MTNEEYNSITATAGIGLSLLGKASALLPNLMTRELTDTEKGQMKSATCIHRPLCSIKLGCSMCGRYEIDKQKAKDELNTLTEQAKELNAKRLFLQLELAKHQKN